MLNYLSFVDLRVEGLILAMHSAWVTSLFAFLTNFGGPAVIVPVFFGTSIYLWRNHRGLFRYYVAYFATSEIVVYALKFFVDRPRPLGGILYGETDGSMPSGHAAASIFVYGFICYLLNNFSPEFRYKKVITYSLVLLVLLIGFSRLYLDVHFLSDVLAGYFIGGFSLWRLAKNN
ncbi:MAG: phosphatase PAP2 family protein [Candidatus Vogelbacteria bacterium]|nr:phosphatase PAP2 family protein [Candidatus Vogelbacteria bacterium]